MKMKQLMAMCGIAGSLMWAAGNAVAQDNGGPGGPPPGGPGGGWQGGGPGGGGGGGWQGGGGRGGFDPAAMQQRIMDNVRDQLGFTNDTDWSAVQPLVQKVLDTRREVGTPDMRRLMGGRNRGGNDMGGRRGGMFGAPRSQEAEALQADIDANASADQIKAALTKYRDAQKAKQAAFAEAQENLRAVLTVKQEAQATLLGLVN